MMSQQDAFVLFNSLRRKRKRRDEEFRRASHRRRKRKRKTFKIAALMMCYMLYENMQCFFHVPRPLVPDHRFDPANLGTSFTGGLEAEHLFRFTSEQLYYLVDALRIPWIMKTEERDKFYGIEGLCIMLRRLVFPVRYMDMVQLFGRQTGPMSRINRHMLKWIYARWHHLNDFDANKVIIKKIMHVVANQLTLFSVLCVLCVRFFQSRHNGLKLCDVFAPMHTTMWCCFWTGHYVQHVNPARIQVNCLRE